MEEDNHVPAIELPARDTATSGYQVSFRSLGGGSVGRRTQDSADAPARALTPGEGRGPSHPDLSRFPGLRRRKAKLDVDMSSLRETVEGIGKEECSKRKAELIEKVKVEESLGEVAKLYDGAVEAMPWEDQRDARRARDLSYDSLEKWIRGVRAKVRRHTKELPNQQRHGPPWTAGMETKSWPR